MTGPGDEGAASPSSMGQRRRRPEPSPTQRALTLLTRREHSRQELARKLQQRGVARDEADAVIAKLADAGWQDEARFAESLLRSRAGSGHGPAYVRAELAMHGLDEALVAATLDGFEGDWLDIARDLLRRRHPQALMGDRDAQRKALDFLLRRGFSMELARAALAGGRDD